MSAQRCPHSERDTAEELRPAWAALTDSGCVDSCVRPRPRDRWRRRPMERGAADLVLVSPVRVRPVDLPHLSDLRTAVRPRQARVSTIV